MKLSFQQKRLSSLQFQKNFLGGLTVVLLAVVALQTLFLFFRNERTLILPPETRQSYWIEGNRFAPSYLEEMALYFTHLLLDVTESNILYQGEIVLRYVEPQAYGHFKNKVFEDEQRLKKDHLSLHFMPIECEVSPTTLSAIVTGELMGYVGSKKVSRHRESYHVVFSQAKGRLFLKSFTVIKTDQPGLSDDTTLDKTSKDEGQG
jgi:conjugal transfer pilus assembly protein TraE